MTSRTKTLPHRTRERTNENETTITQNCWSKRVIFTLRASVTMTDARPPVGVSDHGTAERGSGWKGWKRKPWMCRYALCAYILKKSHRRKQRACCSWWVSDDAADRLQRARECAHFIFSWSSTRLIYTSLECVDGKKYNQLIHTFLMIAFNLHLKCAL